MIDRFCRSLAVVAGLLLVSSPVLADRPAVPPPPAAATKKLLAQLKDAAKCADKASPWRSWCAAADFDAAKLGDLPKGTVLIGTTIVLEDGYSVRKALAERVQFVALALDAGGKALLTYITPETKDEEKMIAEALFSTAAVLKGKAKRAKLPAELAGHLKTFKGAYAISKSGDGNEWRWPSPHPSRMRRAGAFWVVLESAPNGVYATVLTDAWE